MSQSTQAMKDYAKLECVDDYAERKRILGLNRIFRAIREEHRNGGRILELFAKYQRMYGLKSLQRKYYLWFEAERRSPGEGIIALVDGRKLKRPEKENVFLRDFKNYCERNKNSGGCHEAHRQMLRDFRCGDVQFSFGTWRDIWRVQHPFEEMPAVCPSDWVPLGMTYQNLIGHYSKEKGRDIALEWNRRGMFAASNLLPPVLRSRIGLHPGEVYQSDDVWHNIDVYAPGIKGIFQPLEFTTYDVSSAFKVGSLMKPRTMRTDPKTGREIRDNLKEQQFRFEVAGIMCNTGFYRGGVTWIGERGTTRLNDRVLERIAAVPGWGGLFRWSVSGVLNSPAHKGLLIGDCGGNPRMKALCECSHNILHNASAGLLGNRGRDAAHMHESRTATVRYTKEMIALASRIDPALIPFLQLPILEWKHYLAYFGAIEASVMDRCDHSLEGWSDREVVEYRLKATDGWLSVNDMLCMDEAERIATNAVISRDPAQLMRKRKMSRREAWVAGLKDLVRWPIFDACAFLDPGDKKRGIPGDWRKATVGQDGTISFVDSVYYPGERKVYLAQYRDRKGMPHDLRPGSEVCFYWCPTLSGQIWITDENGVENFGIAPALKTAAWVDPESIKVAIGQRQHRIAELMADTRARHAESHVARVAAENVNRVLIKEAEAVKIAGPRSDGEGYSLEDLAGADEAAVSYAAADCAESDTDSYSLDELNAV